MLKITLKKFRKKIYVVKHNLWVSVVSAKFSKYCLSYCFPSNFSPKANFPNMEGTPNNGPQDDNFDAFYALQSQTAAGGRSFKVKTNEISRQNLETSSSGYIFLILIPFFINDLDLEI